tara:strand:+ start:753 stop:890 length:138 start_codon:yes stop_codon:yes gene_type:complete
MSLLFFRFLLSTIENIASRFFDEVGLTFIIGTSSFAFFFGTSDYI